MLREDAQADFSEVAHEPISRRPIAAMSAFTRRRWQVIDPAYADSRDNLNKLREFVTRSRTPSRP